MEAVPFAHAQIALLRRAKVSLHDVPGGGLGVMARFPASDSAQRVDGLIFLKTPAFRKLFPVKRQ
jgi:hypothetical protein